MSDQRETSTLFSGANLRAGLVMRFIAGVFTACLLAGPVASAQSFQVLHTFSNGADGANPVAGVTIVGQSTLYGTASQGGSNGDGVVYELKRHGSAWTLNPLHEFDGSDGNRPQAGVVPGPSGGLYGTTTDGGAGDAGTVFELQSPPTACKTSLCDWQEDKLYDFIEAENDGAQPFYGSLVFDSAGSIYGTALDGFYGEGTVYELIHGSPWTVNLLYTFDNIYKSDGTIPLAGLIFDTVGNLYGTTETGGNTACSNGCGTVFELTPSSGTWTENLIYEFNAGASGSHPTSTLTADPSGNLYGTTLEVQGGQGTIFELQPSGGLWNFSVLYTFGSCQPHAGVTLDSAGNLYGTCFFGGVDGYGMVYKLANSGGSRTLSDLHDFTGGADGANPSSSVALDSSGNIYGTAVSGGNPSNCTGGCGTVWEIMP